MAASIESIRAGIQPLIQAAGADLEDLQIQQAGRREIVRVVVDRDGGIDLDLVADISRQVSSALEAEPLSDEFAESYVLEVSSPGVDRPLVAARHWRRAVSRLVDVHLLDGSTVLGRITSASDMEVILEITEGKSTSTLAIPLANIDRGRVQIEFNRTNHEGVEDGH